MSLNLHFPGNERIRLQLERALASGRLAPSYLFEGAPGAGQEQAAVELAAAFIVGDTSLDHPDARRVRRYSHPDLHYLLPVLKVQSKAWDQHSPEELLALFREQQGHKAADPYYLPQFDKQPRYPVKGMRAILEVLAAKPFEGRGQALILREAEQMEDLAQDTLLKTLEEVPRNTLIILISYQPEALRPTILSRCQRLPFDPLTPAVLEAVLSDRGVEPQRAATFAVLAEGDIEQAIRLASAEDGEGGGNALLARREEWLDLLDRCEFGSELAMMDALQGFLRQGAKDNPTQTRADFLALAISWYREVLRHVMEPGRPRVHVDQIERLRRYRDLSAEGLVERIRSCEKARLQILGNVHAELTLLSLFFSFRTGRSLRRSA